MCACGVEVIGRPHAPTVLRKEPLVSVGEETVSPKASLAAGCDRDMCQSLNLGTPFHSH